jgi:DNA-binding response OmpR family regulator
MAGFEYVLNQDARLLFVDDDPILREFAQVNLSSPTVCVDLASNGGEALDLLEAGNYDAIDEAFRLGATSFVTKPLNWRLLSYQIRFIIRASRAEADLRYAAQKKRA